MQIARSSICSEGEKPISTTSWNISAVIVHPVVFLGLLIVAISCSVLTNVAKYAWKSRLLTWTFAIIGSLSVLALLVVFMISE